MKSAGHGLMSLEPIWHTFTNTPYTIDEFTNLHTQICRAKETKNGRRVEAARLALWLAWLRLRLATLPMSANSI